MFPSFNSIEEIRVSSRTTMRGVRRRGGHHHRSKAGTSHFHGGVFENHENTVLNSNDAFALAKPKIIMNDFGGTLGGPLKLPAFLTGGNKTFSSSATRGCGCRAKRPSC
jgi:hypothetical protein